MSDLLGRHGPKLAVGGLVLLNLVLIGTLVLRDPVRAAVPAEPVPASTPRLTATQASSAAETTTSTVTSLTPEPSPSDTLSTAPSPSPSESQQSRKAVSRPRLLAANSGQVAWRAEGTGCRGTAVVEVTTNGGRSWSKTKPGLSAIVRLKAYGSESVFAVGADDTCRPTYAWITGPQQTWQRDGNRVANVWYRNPNNLDEVHAPGGLKTKPCGKSMVDFAGLGTSQAAALCADGRIRTAADGRSWRTVQTRSEVLSLNADDDQFVAASIRSSCSGVVIHRFNSSGSGLGGKGRCRSKIKAKRGATVVSTHYQQVWLWSGDRVSSY